MVKAENEHLLKMYAIIGGKQVFVSDMKGKKVF